MKWILYLSCLLLSCAQVLPVWAAADKDEKDKDKAHVMVPITVSAQAQSEPPTSAFWLPQSSRAATWVIDQKQIQALQPRDLFDVLAYAPGLQLSFQGRKAMNFLSGRGGGGYAILLDGMYLPWTQSSRVLANFPVGAIESISIVRDSTILTLGPLAGLGSMGLAVQGFIIIKTHKPAAMENKVRLSYGNLNRFKAFAQHGDKKDRFYYSLAYSKQHDDGRDDWNNGSDSDAVFVKGGYESQGLKIDLNFYHDWAWREIQRPTEDNTVYDAKWKYDPLNTMLISATLAKQWNESQTTSAGFYRGRIDTDLQKESFSKSGFLSVHSQEDEAIQADLRHIITTQNNIFRVGGQAIWWKTPTGQFYYENKPREEELYSVYLYDQYALSENFKIDAGARMDKKHITKGIDKFAPTQTTTALIEDKWAEPYYTLTLGAAYQLGEKCEFSFRTSYVEQSTDNFILTVDDKSLPAEKQLRYEVGITGQIHPAFNPTLTLFYYDISNLKTSVGSIRIGPDDVNIYDAIDVGRSGFELDFRGRLWDDHFSYGLTYTYQTSNSDKDDREMPNHMASLRLGYTLNPFQANLMFLYMAKYDAARFAVDKKVHEVGGIKRVDANISYGFNVGKAKMRATLFGQNLTDQHYETRLGWEDVGLTFGLELSTEF